VDLGLKGRVALIAGSSRGIGRAIARAFLAEGCRTMLTGRDAAKLESVASEFSAEFGADTVLAFAGDLRSEDAVVECRGVLQARWGTPDFVVANIGSGRAAGGPVPDVQAWQDAFDANLWASVRVVQDFLPGMLARRSGSVVMIGSIAGSEGIAAPIPYSAAKAALGSWTKNLARQVGRSGVRVNLIAPGNVLFDGGSWAQKSADDPENVRKYLESEVPLGRFGTPEEIASIAVFLCSLQAGFITGARITADGGQTRSA
jgi:3-oxoacyl-[acyl-carrier protein] reductase